MATIKDVAKLADVSISTVSHVINGTRFVSPVATERVHAAIEELGYKPSAVARSLKTNRTRTIGMLTSSNTNPFFAEVIHGVEATCNERGYHLVLCNSGHDSDKKISNIKTLEEKRVDGLLIMTAHSEPEFFQTLQDCSESPMVILDCQSPGINADIIMEDPEIGGYEATRYLIDQGFESIACISGPQHLSPSNGRFAGYHRAMREAGLEVNPFWVVEGELNAESGYKATKKLLTGVREDFGKTPEAIFAGNDLMAMGAICAIQSLGYKVPDDISVIGYDDIELAAFTSPPLTTMHQPKAQLGQLAAETLLNRIEDPSIEPVVRTLKSSLIERHSVKQKSKNVAISEPELQTAS